VLARLPLHPVLLAAYAVLFLYAENLSEVLLIDVQAPLARAVLGATAATLVLGLLFRNAARGALVASALVAGVFGYGHVAGLLAGGGPDDRLLLGAWVVVVLVAIVTAVRARSVARLTSGLNVLALVLVILAAASIVPYELARVARAPVTQPGSVVAGEAPPTTRDIWYLVFDRYGSASAIERRFGITGNDLYGWLADRGFHVPADSRANYRATDFSLASTLNLRYLDELTEEVGPNSGDRTPARRLIQDHAVGHFLQERGYRYYHIGSWFDPTSAMPFADESLGPGVTSEFESVLRDTTVLPAIDRVSGVETPEATFRDRHREGTLFAFRQLHRLQSAPGPKFVFAHVLLPHDPYVFRADGSPISEAQADAEDEAGLYEGQLEYANARIKALVEDLLDVPEATRPIVIVQADEGPLLCRSVDCPEFSADYMAIRFGILNALYLPGITEPLPARWTPVNTFRLIFREYFGADLEPLPDRSYTWPDNDHIYDFRDVTDLLEPSG
jgi:hypothetical protein